MEIMIVVFKILEVSLSVGGDESKYPETKFSIIQALEDRYAEFDKIIEADPDDVGSEIDDYDNQSEAFETYVEIDIQIDPAGLEHIESDRDIIFQLALRELRDDNMKIVRDFKRDQVSYIGFANHSK